jgi:ribosomal protein L14E/L6E/L27E
VRCALERDRYEFTPLKPGQIVRVKAGREKGLFMVVTGVVDENFILLSDGDHRKIISPKKKKIKHVLKTNTVCPEVAAALTDDSITDKMIRNALSKFNNANKEEGDQN